jgi:hypothetical protein
MTTPVIEAVDVVKFLCSGPGWVSGARKLFLSYTVISFVRRHSQRSP